MIADLATPSSPTLIVGTPGKENGLDEFQHLDDYALLGVSSGATPDDIKRAYRREIAKYHPDRYRAADPHTQQYVRERSQRITEAYSALSRGARQRASAAVRRQPTVGPQAAGASQVDVLYQQATTRLREGHVDQAIHLLHQLQRIEPFFRDVAELLARAEHMRAAAGVAGGAQSRRPFVWLGAGMVGLFALLVGTWGTGALWAGRVADSTPAGVLALASADAPSVAPQAPSEPPQPSVAPTSADPPASAAGPADHASTTVPPPAESMPTPTVVGPAEVAVSPSPAQSRESVAPPVLAPSPTPAAAAAAPSRRPLAVEGGRVLVADAFNDPGSGWANIQAATYTLGYRDGAYAITTEPGTGSIFAFGAPLAQGNMVIGADVTPVRGLAGMIFGPDKSYRFFISGDGRFRVEQQGKALVPLTASKAIRRGSNRLAIAAADKRVSLYANGVLLTNLDLPVSLEGTTYGFVVLAGPGGGEGIFDSLSVRTLPR